jgi:hypothetical protein
MEQYVLQTPRPSFKPVRRLVLLKHIYFNIFLMKYFLFFCGLLIACSSFFVQDDPAAPILWQKKSLRWKNFRDVPDSQGPHAKSLAVTNSRLEQRYYRVGNELHFIIAAWFNPNKSWVRDGVSGARYSDEVLSHEQHHFDMCELYARKIRRYLSTAVFTEATYKKEIPELFKTFHTQYRAEQNKYDSELKERVYRQDEWTESIDVAMKELKTFTDTAVIVKIQ